MNVICNEQVCYEHAGRAEGEGRTARRARASKAWGIQKVKFKKL